MTSEKPVIVLMHGYGSHEHDLVPVAEMIAPDLEVLSLRAPIELSNGGAAWFQLLDEHEDARLAEIDTAVAGVWKRIDEHFGEHRKVIAIGFSQGGLMASQLLRTKPERVAATIIFAGIVSPAEYPADALLAEQKPEVFYGKGDEDVLLENIRWFPGTISKLESIARVDKHFYPGLAHSLNEKEISDAREYLKRILG